MELFILIVLWMVVVGVFWTTVIWWAHRLLAQSDLDAFRPTPADVDRAERELGVHP